MFVSVDGLFYEVSEVFEGVQMVLGCPDGFRRFQQSQQRFRGLRGVLGDLMGLHACLKWSHGCLRITQEVPEGLRNV